MDEWGQRETALRAELLNAAGDMETILIVDDEEINISVLQECLEIMGYKVMTARSGQHAVDLYRRHSQDIHLVILDIIMPGMNGGEVFDAIKAIRPDVRAILSSGYSSDGEASRIMRRGAKGFVQKPFRVDMLVQKIREVLSS
jgi:CheY-like chemotaxis protein